MGSASRLPMSCRWPATQSTFGRCWLHSSACSRRSSREAYTITRIHYYTKRLSALRVDFAKLRGTLSGRLKGGSPCLRKAGLIRRPAFVCPRTTSDVWSDSGGHERLTTVICRAFYFRCVERQWRPRTVDDRDLPSLVYAAGKSYGWSLRELCIARMLFESGPRISEICSLTAADWARSRFGASFDAPNKGSHGGRTKILLVSQPTVKLLHKYFDGEFGRRACDRTRLTMKDLLTLVDQRSTGLRDIADRKSVV